MVNCCFLHCSNGRLEPDAFHAALALAMFLRSAIFLTPEAVTPAPAALAAAAPPMASCLLWSPAQALALEILEGLGAAPTAASVAPDFLAFLRSLKSPSSELE